MTNTDTAAYGKAFIRYLRKGTPIEYSLKEETRSTPYYIWRTQGDDKVRASHVANNGRIFAWNDPPDTGHPGEAINCRCWAEPYVKGRSEYAYQTIVSPINDVAPKWTNFDLTRHYYTAKGRGVTLSEIGHLRGVIDYYFHQLGKYNDVNAQIVEEARRHGTGEFGYHFDNSYGLEGYLYVFGDGVVAGVFSGNVIYNSGVLNIQGNVEYFYDDVFTDPLDIRELLKGTSDPEDLNWIEQITEFGGSYFPIKDYWKTQFSAEVKFNAESSIYQEQ